MRLAMMPSQPCFRACSSIFLPSPSIDSVMRTLSEIDLPICLTSSDLRSAHGSSSRTVVAAHQDVEENEACRRRSSVALDHLRLLDVHSDLKLLESSRARRRSVATISPSSTKLAFFFLASERRALDDLRKLSGLVLPVSRYEPDVGRALRMPGRERRRTSARRSTLAGYVGSDRRIHRLEVGNGRRRGGRACAVSARARLTFAGSLIRELPDDAARLLCQTLLLPDAISSIVLPVSTDVMLSATMSSVEANSSRCLMKSHCGFDELCRRDDFMRTSAHEPRMRSPKNVILRSPRA